MLDGITATAEQVMQLERVLQQQASVEAYVCT